MQLRVAVIMDPIERIHFKKDTTLALLIEAQKRNYSLYYLEQKDLFLKDGIVYGQATPITVYENPDCWFSKKESFVEKLGNFDLILMRKDPPFDMEYIYSTYLLEFAQNQGAKVVNDPRALRDANEKLFAQWFPECMPPTLVTREASLLREFIATHSDVILKPLHAMGGGSIFRLKLYDNNVNVAIEMLTDNGSRHIMAQQFIPEVFEGDKRIFVIDGKPLPYALARIPATGEIRGNLAAGGRAQGVSLTEKDYWLCDQISSTLSQKGLLFVGLDVIGGYITEINVTSPTCVRELQTFYDINVCSIFWDQIEGLF